MQNTMLYGTELEFLTKITFYDKASCFFVFLHLNFLKSLYSGKVPSTQLVPNVKKDLNLENSVDFNPKLSKSSFCWPTFKSFRKSKRVGAG